MEPKTDARLGWQGWLWLALVAACLAALALGLGFLRDSASTERSAAVGASGAVTVLLSDGAEGQRSSGTFPLESAPVTSTTSVRAFSTSTAGAPVRSAITSSTTGKPPATSSTTSGWTTTTRLPTTSATTRQSTSASPTTAAAKAERPSSTTTTTERATTTQATNPTPESTVWTGPVAVDDRLAVGEGKEGKPKVLDNDRPGDASLDEHTLTIISAPANAKSYKVHDDHLHYRPADGFLGTDRIRYRICDVDGRCDTASVFITVG